MTPVPSTVVVSSVSVLTGGGLSVYGRRLVEWLASEQGSAVTIARFSREGVPYRAYASREPTRTTRTTSGVEVRIIAPQPALVPALHLLGRTIDRRSLDWLTLSVMSAAFGQGLDRAIPRDADVVHYVGSAWELLGFAALRVARRRGLGFTMSPAIHPGQWGDGPLDARLLATADVVFALSAVEASALKRLGVSSERICLTPLGPNVVPSGEAQRFRERHALEGAPVVLFIGRKQAYKGFDALLEAVWSLRHDVPGARVVTIGSGDVDRRLPEGVLDLGEVDEQTKADALAACDVFCMPSAGEAFGMVYVEAWSYAKPVVVGPAPAARELVEHGRTGLHADQDAASVANALVALLSDPHRAREMGEAGRRIQRASYTWQDAWAAHRRGLAIASDQAGRL